MQCIMNRMEKYKQETPIKARCSVCDEKFGSIIQCREHIIDNHRSGFDVSGENEFEYRRALTFGDLEWVDENIWVLMREPDVGARWRLLFRSYHLVFPFNLRVALYGLEPGTRFTLLSALRCWEIGGMFTSVTRIRRSSSATTSTQIQNRIP